MIILSQSQTQSVRDGSVLHLFINVIAGSGNYTYQWKKNAVDIVDATNSTYRIENFIVTDVATYTVVVNDGIDTITSLPIVLALSDAFSSEQNQLINFDNLSPTTKKAEITIPMSSNQNLRMMNLWAQRRANLLANVEIPLLQAERYKKDTIAGGAYYDPKAVFPVPTFKVTLRGSYK